MFPALLLAIIFGFVIVIVKMAMDHEKEKLRLKAGTRSDNSLRESELKALIREAVEEANAPLLARVERLEQKALPPHTPESTDA